MTSHQYIGVDVGGTKIAVTTMLDGQLSPPVVEATELGDSAALIEQLIALIEGVRSPTARAVGIGVPSIVEFATGRIRHSVNIPLTDVPLRALLSERLGMPVYVDNDANCAALAEAYDGNQLTGTQLVMITVGTGVGGGLGPSGLGARPRPRRRRRGVRT